MKTGDGFQQCYNAQIAMDGEAQLIVSTRLDPEATGQRPLIPLPDEIAGTFEVLPDGVRADAGSRNEAELEAQGIDGHVTLCREGKALKTGASGRLPATTRMEAKLATPEGRAALRQTQVAVPSPSRMDQGGAGVPTVRFPALCIDPG